MENLGLVSTADLMHELASRCDTCVIGMEFKENKRSSRKFFYSNGQSAAIGLLELMKFSWLNRSEQAVNIEHS